ncbi:uncharacterized protein LOC128708966 [Anopheles marshallii]|uniref:uncharacterized protein LOC128708966 n=1 Tax=Anopheles marshallii TaxID=1521116 RepID=UPI00237ABBE1|nr:uncharacterized protein LOC128708966 [Anopheles marshallii]
MSSSAELRELRNAFDSFSVWILAHQVTNPNTSISFVHGKNIHRNLRNYMLALISDKKNDVMKLALLEFHLTKAQFELVSKDTREQDIALVLRYWNVASAYSIQHYLYIANEWPALEHADGISILNDNDFHLFDLLSLSTNALCMISAAREQCDARNKDVYEITMGNGQTIRETITLLPKSVMNKPPVACLSRKEYYPIDAKPVNGINLHDLCGLLKACEGGSPLGLLVVRQAMLKNILLYVKKCCVDRLENVTQDTWFLVSEDIPFETKFPDHETIHELAFVKDYGMVFWLRSRGPPTPISKYFTISCWNEYDSVPPAPCWLNVLVSNVSDGSSTYLQRLAATVRRADPCHLIVQVQAVDVVKVLQQPDTTVLDKLNAIFGVRNEAERNMLATVQLVLLIDHAIADNGSDGIAQTLVQFLNVIDDSIRQHMTVWIVGDDLLWTRVATNCKHLAMKHSMPKLEEDQWKDCLSRMVKKSNVNMGQLAESITAGNSRNMGQDLFGNLFILTVLAEAVNGHIDSEENGKPSYWWIDALEKYIWKNIALPESKELEELEQYCYERVCMDYSDHTKHFSMRSRIKHRTLQMLLAAKYLAKHSHLIDTANYHRIGYGLLDLMLFRHSSVAIAVLHHDVDTVRQSTPEELQSIRDCLQRNLLHVVYNSTEIADILLSAGIPFDQQCARQLNNWTPLQVAINRNDWSLVDRLLAKDAKLSSQETKLHGMPVSELAEVFNDCISDNCTTLIEWILNNRSDYQINQQNIFCLSAYEEFDTALLFRLLTIAQEQGLATREPPYRYIFDNSALDNAVEDDRIELATFLVERLRFEPTDEFLELRARYQQNAQLKQYKKMFELCKAGELTAVRQMIDEVGLDPHYEYDDTNLFIQAASSGNVELVRYLFEAHGFDERLDDCDEHGCSAISQALVNGHQPIVQFLLNHKASVKPSWIKNCPGQLPDDSVEADTEDFLSLIDCRREKLERLTIDYGRYEAGELLLHCYIRYVDEPDEDTFRFLLSRYGNVDVRTDVTSELRLGETPLHIALQNGNKRCRELLIEAGADIHAKSLQHELTSLHYAIMGGADKSFVQRLIEVYGFDVNTRDGRGRTISFYMPLNTEFYCWLIDQYQFDPCASDNNGQTVLHHRVIRNSFFARAEIEYLLKMSQFSQSKTDKRGRFPLHYAVEANNLAIVQLLVKYRSDLHNIPDSDGVTALKIAHNLNHSTICDFFAKLGE